MPDEPLRGLWSRQFGPTEPTPVSPTAAAEYLKSLEAPSQPAPISLPPPQEKSAIDKIGDATVAVRKTIADGKLTKGFQVQWLERIRIALRPVFGKQSALLTTLDEWRKEMIKTPPSVPEFISRVEQVEHFLKLFSAPAVSGSFAVASRRSLCPATKNVFVVHGHDELNRLKLCQLISNDFKLNPIVLLDQPGKSFTTIEKFEDHAQRCSYAVALFTEDDRVVAKNGDEYYQPRPNVIFETGWFVGRLGKERVLILLQDGVRIHSDFEGVNRIEFHSDVEDKFRKIQTELQASGLI